MITQVCDKHGQYIATVGVCPVCEGANHSTGRRRVRVPPALIDAACRERPASCYELFDDEYEREAHPGEPTT